MSIPRRLSAALLLATAMCVSVDVGPVQAKGGLRLTAPFFIATDRHDRVYVANIDTTRRHSPIEEVEEIDPSGHLIRTWVLADTALAIGVAVDARGHVFTAGPLGLHEYGPSGALVANWGKPKLLSGQLIALEGIALDRAGNIYVADASGHQILKYSSAHALIAHWKMASGGIHGDETAGPNGIAVDGAGMVYVTDTRNNRPAAVLKYGASGKLIHRWRIPGRPPRLFGGFGLGGIALDHAGNIYVADRYADSVVKLSAAGVVLARIRGAGAGKLTRLYGLALDHHGDIYVSAGSDAMGRVVKLSPRGSVLAVWR